MEYLLKIDSNLKYLINQEVDDWEEGDSTTFKFGFYEVGIVDEPTTEELDLIMSRIAYIDDLSIDDDEMLLVKVNENVLIASYEARLQEWKTERKMLNYEYWNSRGV